MESIQSPRTYLISHGENQVGETFVPEGMTLYFFVPEGTELPSENIEKIIWDDEEPLYPPLTGGQRCANRELPGNSPLQFSLKATAAKPNATLIWIGDGVDPGFLCTPGLSDECEREHQHVCGGVFQQLSEKGYSVIYMLICRGGVAQQGDTSSEVAGPLEKLLPREQRLGIGEDEGFSATIDQLTAKFVKTLNGPGGSVATAAWFDSLPPEQRLGLQAGRFAVMWWVELQAAVTTLATSGEQVFYQQRFVAASRNLQNLYLGIPPEGTPEMAAELMGPWFKTATSLLKRAVDGARHHLTNWLYSDPDGFGAWLSSKGDDLKTDLLICMQGQLQQVFGDQVIGIKSLNTALELAATRNIQNRKIPWQAADKSSTYSSQVGLEWKNWRDPTERWDLTAEEKSRAQAIGFENVLSTNPIFTGFRHRNASCKVDLLRGVTGANDFYVREYLTTGSSFWMFLDAVTAKIARDGPSPQISLWYDNDGRQWRAKVNYSHSGIMWSPVASYDDPTTLNPPDPSVVKK